MVCYLSDPTWNQISEAAKGGLIDHVVDFAKEADYLVFAG